MGVTARDFTFNSARDRKCPGGQLGRAVLTKGRALNEKSTKRPKTVQMSSMRICKRNKYKIDPCGRLKYETVDKGNTELTCLKALFNTIRWIIAQVSGRIL